jgi:hypothetical protein
MPDVDLIRKNKSKEKVDLGLGLISRLVGLLAG